jgi:hypothetical protein
MPTSKPKNILVRKTLNDPYGINSSKRKPRQRPWSSVARKKKSQEHNKQRNQKWKAGGIRVTRNYLGRGVSKPKPFLSYADHIKLKEFEQKYIEEETKQLKHEKERVNLMPQYSVKYVGVTKGEMGVLSKRCLLPTMSNRIPNNYNYQQKEQKFRLDPDYLQKIKERGSRDNMNRPSTASGISYSLSSTKQNISSNKRPSTSPSKEGSKHSLDGTEGDEGSGSKTTSEEVGIANSNSVSALKKNNHTSSQDKTVNNKFINTNNKNTSRPRTAPYKKTLWTGKDKNQGGMQTFDKNNKRPETASILESNTLNEEDEEGDQPNPDKYDRWIVRAIPPRAALSAGRKRELLPANTNNYSNFGRRKDYGAKHNRISRLRPGSAPASSYIISSQQFNPSNNNNNMQQLQTNLLQQQVPQQAEAPYQVHKRIRGWKLTSPHNLSFNANTSQTRKQMYIQQQMLQNNNNITNVPSSSANHSPHNNFSNMVKHERLTAEDIMAENMGRVAMMRPQQLPNQQYANIGNYNRNAVVGDVNAPPSLLQPMMDPLNQVVEEEKRLRVKMRQTNAVVNQLDRWQRGRSAKPWRSGHHWDSPHPEVPLNVGKEFRWMSSTPSEYANMVRQNEMEMNYEGLMDAEIMDNFDNNPMMMHNVNSGDISEDEVYLQHLKQKLTRFDDTTHDASL